MKSHYLLFLLFLMLQPGLTFGQLKQTHHFEEEVKNSEEGYHVISLKKEGLALIQETKKFSQGKKAWKLEILDTTLSRIWLTELNLGNKLVLVGYEHNPGHLYLLFRDGQTEFHNFTLVTVPFYERSITEERVVFELNFRVTHFSVAGNTAIFGGEVNNEPAVLLYSQDSDHPKVLPGLFKKYQTLLDIRVNQNQSFNVLMAEQRVKEAKKLILRTFDHEGNMLLEDIIPFDAKYSILTGLTSGLERDELVLAGTYAIAGNRQAVGYYSVIADPFTDQPVTYTDFVSLEHFLDYLSPRKAERIRTKAAKRKTIGQAPEYTAYVMPFRIQETSNGFYLLSEMYYPSTSIGAYPTYASLYNPYGYGYYSGLSPYTPPYSMSPSPNVEMIQTMVVQLSPQAKPVKSVSLKLDSKQDAMDQVGDFIIARDSIWIAYKKEGEILFERELPDSDEEIVPASKREPHKLNLQDPIKTMKHLSDDTGVVRYWYGSNLYVWGYQTVKGVREDGGSTRHIFYVNRISVE